MDRKAKVAIQVSQTVSGVQYISKSVSEPLLVKAGDIPCRSSPGPGSRGMSLYCTTQL